MFSRSKEEHFCILNEVFSRISNAGGRLKLGKCILMGEELTYLGVCISQSGRSLDPELIRLVLEFPVPSSCTEVKSFLGLVQYYGHFIPHLLMEASPLHELMQKDVVFSRSEKRQASFQNIKSAIANSPVLTHYDPCLPLLLSTDASPIGFGAIF
uniref:RNA-directed DNA polymerase n=1 Tax=Lepeophtheirus salmonis TaxID=72036 RepID=A0A0K2U150_LEPSM